jgi:hypothetical protein
MAMLHPDARPHRKLSRSIAGRRRGRSIVSAGIAPEAGPEQRAAFERAAKSGPSLSSAAAPPAARNRHRHRQGSQPAKGPHPANTGPMDDERYRRDPARVPNAGRAARNAKQHEAISLAKDPPISVALPNELRFSQGERDHTGTATYFGLAFWSG